jgi:hypothetical protein
LIPLLQVADSVEVACGVSGGRIKAYVVFRLDGWTDTELGTFLYDTRGI